MSGPLRTKVITAWDHTQADLSLFCKPFEMDKERMAEDMLFLQKKYAYLVPVETVEAGDIVTMRCRSSKPKFQKDSVTINVGKNLYSRELEEKLVGMAVGEEKELTVGETAVMVYILKAERNTLPELTDEFLSKNLKKIRSMTELVAWYTNAYFEDHLKQCAAEAANFLQEQALIHSKIAVDEEERRVARVGAEKTLHDMWEMNGLPLDQMTDDQAQELLGYPNAQAYIDWFADLCEKDVPYAALGYALLANDGKAPTEESYREARRKMIEEEGTPEDQLTDYTYHAYGRQVCAEHYRNVLETHAYEIIKEKLS